MPISKTNKIIKKVSVKKTAIVQKAAIVFHWGVASGKYDEVYSKWN